MSDEAENPWYKDWIVTFIIGTMLMAMPAGILLAVYLNDGTWALISLVAFILIYAG